MHGMKQQSMPVTPQSCKHMAHTATRRGMGLIGTGAAAGIAGAAAGIAGIGAAGVAGIIAGIAGPGVATAAGDDAGSLRPGVSGSGSSWLRAAARVRRLRTVRGCGSSCHSQCPPWASSAWGSSALASASAHCQWP